MPARFWRETCDYKNLRREMGSAVGELIRAVKPKEIKIEVAIENSHVTKSPQDTPPVEGPRKLV